MRAFTISTADVERCPIGSLAPSHYRDDGTCRCPGDDHVRVPDDDPHPVFAPSAYGEPVQRYVATDEQRHPFEVVGRLVVEPDT